MDKVIAALQHWLHKNGINDHGVYVDIVFPGADERYHAEVCMKHDTEPMLAHGNWHSQGLKHMAELYGIGINFKIVLPSSHYTITYNG